MSSQRVIQDSDDEDGDILSEVPSSCDPLQDSSYAPKEMGSIERVQEIQPGLQAQVQARFSASELPQVDFDRFLRSESSIMAGDYEDERWVSTAHSNPGNVIPFGNLHTAQTQLQDHSFRYAVNAPHNALDLLPPTSTGDYNGAVADDHDHPAKRRKVSNTNTQDTLLKEPEGTGSSYNFFASPDPNGTPQTATSLPPVQYAEESNGIAQDFETEPLPMGTPPPTIPFSEDPLPQEQEASAVEARTAEYEVQGAIIRQPPAETDCELLSTRKKRGRPKKQDSSEAINADAMIVPENVPEALEQPSTKKKPGRPKKQETNATVNQSPVADQEATIEGVDSTTTAAKSLKKKVKRSKTTSDIPHTKSDEMRAEHDMVWIETNLSESVPVGNIANNTEQAAVPVEETKAPKKRGRKKKEVAEEPAVASERQTVIQDISDIRQQAPQEKKEDINVETDKANLQAPDVPETSTVEIQGKPIEGDGGFAIPTLNENNKSLKQTPISSAGRVPFRVGLSRKARIAPLLKIVRK